MELFFKPKPGAFPDGKLRVAPDLLPKGSIRIESVTVNGENYTEFDAEALTVTLPESREPVAVRVCVAPTSGLDHFKLEIEQEGDTAKVTLQGELDTRAVPHFLNELLRAAAAKRVVLVMDELTYLCPEGARVLVFAKQKMDVDEEVVVVGASGQPKEVLEREEFAVEVTMKASLDTEPVAAS